MRVERLAKVPIQALLVTNSTTTEPQCGKAWCATGTYQTNHLDGCVLGGLFRISIGFLHEAGEGPWIVRSASPVSASLEPLSRAVPAAMASPQLGW